MEENPHGLRKVRYHRSSSARSCTIIERRSPSLLSLAFHCGWDISAPKEPQTMTRESRGRFLLRTAGRTLRLAMLSGALAYAQSSTPALPNMGQDLTPTGAFVPLNPGLADHPEWTATHAVSSVVSPLGDTMLVLTSGFNRVYNNPLTKLPLLSAWDPKDST